MPPRRSTRQSLPTPANSTKSGDAQSVSSTPGTSDLKIKINTTGLRTPQSVSDDESPSIVDDEIDVKPEIDKKRSRKFIEHQCERPDQVGVSSPAEEEVFSDTTTQGSGRARYELSVELPSSRKRSRLATEKTTSADNLTLGSPVDRKIKRNSSLMDVEFIDEVCHFFWHCMMADN